MLIASLSLVAFPFMTGFYSKDFILESAYGQYYFSSTVVYIIATIGAMFTTLYSVKVLYLTFLTNPNGPLINYKQAHEGDIFMSLPLMILAVFSIFFGFITKDMFIGLGSGFFADNALFIHPCHEIMLDTEFGVPTLFKILPLIFTISLSVISIVLSEYLSTILIYFKLSRIGYNIFSFFNQRFLIELFYNKFVTGIILKLGGQTTKVIDKGSVEYLGPYGLEKGLLNISNNIGKLNTGIITSYALYILVGLIFYMLFNSYINHGITILILAISLSIVIQSYYSFSPILPSFTSLQSNFLAKNKLKIMKKKNHLASSLIAVLLTTIISFSIRFLVIHYFGLDIFRIDLTPCVAFFSLFGFNGLRLFIKSLTEEYIYAMMPAGGGPQAPQGGGPQVPQGGGPQVPVADPSGIRQRSFINPQTGQRYNTYQPYARNLATYLDSIRPLNGGRATPIYNTYINAADKNWLNSYYQGNNRNASIAQNGINLSKDLRALP